MPPTPAPWIVIDSPLIVFPDGSWGVLISIVALLVSALTLWHTLSAKPRVHAFVMRAYLQFGEEARTDGDEIVIVNLGRTAAVIYDVRALTKNDEHLKSESMPRGYKSEPIAFPEMPQSLVPGGVLTVWFSKGLAGEDAGRDYGYVVTYANTSVRPKVRTEPLELVVKATDAPPPPIKRGTGTSTPESPASEH